MSGRIIETSFQYGKIPFFKGMTILSNLVLYLEQMEADGNNLCKLPSSYQYLPIQPSTLISTKHSTEAEST